jgi:hypothetical protein
MSLVIRDGYSGIIDHRSLAVLRKPSGLSSNVDAGAAAAAAPTGHASPLAQRVARLSRAARYALRLGAVCSRRSRTSPFRVIACLEPDAFKKGFLARRIRSLQA